MRARLNGLLFCFILLGCVSTVFAQTKPATHTQNPAEEQQLFQQVSRLTQQNIQLKQVVSQLDAQLSSLTQNLQAIALNNIQLNDANQSKTSALAALQQNLTGMQAKVSQQLQHIPTLTSALVASSNHVLTCVATACYMRPILRLLPMDRASFDSENNLVLSALDSWFVLSILLALFVLLTAFYIYRAPGSDKKSLAVEASPLNRTMKTVAGEDVYASQLDLARAYIDMDDMKSAEEALQNVINSGNDKQAEEAKQLLGKLKR